MGGPIFGQVASISSSVTSPVTFSNEKLNFAMNYLRLNAGYATVAAQEGGIVMQRLPTVTVDTVTAGSFTPAVLGVSNATVVTDGLGTFSAGDIVDINVNKDRVDGLYEVHSHVLDVLELRGIGANANTVAFVADDVPAEIATGSITKVDVSVLRVNTSGVWETGSGSNVVDFDWTPIMPLVAEEPTGFTNRTDSELLWVDGTRTFTIQPLAPATEFFYYIHGIKYEKTTPQSIILPDATGSHFIYFDGAVLSSRQAPPIDADLLKNYAWVGSVYLDDQAPKLATVINDERHGLMPWQVHLHFHRYFGTQWLSGLAVGDLTLDGNGALDAHAQLSVSDGIIADEDITFETSGTPQVVAVPAELTVLYRIGATWRRKVPDTFPLIYSGDSTGYVGAAGRIAYNAIAGGVGSLVEVSGNNKFMLIHVFTTTDFRTPDFVILGQAEYATIVAAREAAATEIDDLLTTGLPLAEFKAVATIVVKTSGAYVNIPKAAFVTADTGLDYIDWRTTSVGTSGGAASDHQDLTGRDDPLAHEQYVLVTQSRPYWDAVADAAMTSTLYVDNTAVASSNNDGSALLPFASLAEALSHIPEVRAVSSTVTLELVQTGTPYRLPGREPMSGLSRITIQGELPAPIETAAAVSAEISFGPSSGGTVVDLLLTGVYAADDLRGFYVVYGGVLNTFVGWIYQNDVTALGLTRCRITQSKAVAPTTAVGSTVTIYDPDDFVKLDSSEGTTVGADALSISMSSEATLYRLNIGGHIAGANRMFHVQDGASVIVKDCYFGLMCAGVRAYRNSALLEVFCCYINDTDTGGVGYGMLSVLEGQGSSILLRGGNVFDGRNASLGYTYPWVCEEGAGGTITLQGGQVFRGTRAARVGLHVRLGYTNDYTTGRFIFAYEHKAGYPIIELGIRRNYEYTARSGGQCIPDLFGTITHTYAVVGRRCQVTLGPASNVVTSGTVNAVSMDGGLSSCSGVQRDRSKLWCEVLPGATTLINKQTPTGTTVTVDWTYGDDQIVDLDSATGDVAVTLFQPVIGGKHTIKFIQDSGVNLRLVTWTTTVVWATGVAPVIPQTASAIMVVELLQDGTQYLGRVIHPAPAAATIFTVAAGVTSNSGGTYATDDLVFGSPVLADDGDATHDNRMWFDKSKGAFRAGGVGGNQWDDGNVGSYSTALGQGNIASNNYTFGFGASVTVSGLNASAGGSATTATGSYSRATGIATEATGTGAEAGGNSSSASHYGERAVAGGKFAAAGDAQLSDVVWRKSTTTADPTLLTLDGSTDSATNRMNLAAGNVYLFEIQIVAKRTDVAGSVKSWTSKGTIYNNAGTTALVGTTTDAIISDSGVAWTIAVTANDVTDKIDITVTGGAGATIRWVASARMTKVSS